MKKILEPKLLPFLIPGVGCAAMLLQWVLFLFGFDEKGLLGGLRVMHLLAWLLVAAVMALATFCILPLKGHNRYADNFPASVSGAIGAFLAAGGILISVLLLPEESGDILSKLWRLSGFLSVPALCFTGFCRMKGLRPSFFFHGIAFVFFALHLVCRCRGWSSDPMLESYAFPLFACISLMLTAYYRAAFDSGIGRRRMQLFSSMLCCCTCLAAVPSGQHKLLYLTCALWAITNLCVLTPPRRPRPRAEEAPMAPEEG